MKEPSYIQIVNLIKQRIMTGEWTVGLKIPSQHELVHQFGVNRSTVITALDILKSEGWLEGKQGKGTFVANNRPELRPLEWAERSQWSFHPESRKIVQMINRLENHSSFLHLSKGVLGPHLFPKLLLERGMIRASKSIDSYEYGDGRGIPEVREQLAHLLRKKGITVSPDAILIVSGALNGLQLIANGLLQRGSTILTESLSYLYSMNVFRSVGLKLAALPLQSDGIDLKALDTRRWHPELTALYVNPTFHNH
jgi:GntR family transcriptional regulator of abcA and norABC